MCTYKLAETLQAICTYLRPQSIVPLFLTMSLMLLV